MEDITPLNLEDQPKLFGLRYDQLIAILGALLLSTQLYTWMTPIPVMGGHDLRFDITLLIFLCGPLYCLLTLNQGMGHWENLINFYVSSQVYVPGPDPSPVRFLTDEALLEFGEG